MNSVGLGFAVESAVFADDLLVENHPIRFAAEKAAFSQDLPGEIAHHWHSALRERQIPCYDRHKTAEAGKHGLLRSRPKIKEEKIMGKFVIKTGKTGVRFNLLATNGQVIGTSEIYKSDNSCLNGIDSVKRCCAGGIMDLTEEGAEAVKHPRFEVYNDKAGEFRFRLKARNGEIILSSEGYKEKKTCLNGIESVKKNAPEAETVREE